MLPYIFMYAKKNSRLTGTFTDSTRQDICTLFGWVDDMRFYVIFNSVSFISGPLRVIMKGYVQWNPIQSVDRRHKTIRSVHIVQDCSCTVFTVC